ncbi:hypothetical protein ABZP36_018143 [Zizania latifolia]
MASVDLAANSESVDASCMDAATAPTVQKQETNMHSHAWDIPGAHQKRMNDCAKEIGNGDSSCPTSQQTPKMPNLAIVRCVGTRRVASAAAARVASAARAENRARTAAPARRGLASPALHLEQTRP